MRVVKYPDFNKERSKAVLFDGKRRYIVDVEIGDYEYSRVDYENGVIRLREYSPDIVPEFLHEIHHLYKPLLEPIWTPSLPTLADKSYNSLNDECIIAKIYADEGVKKEVVETLIKMIKPKRDKRSQIIVENIETLLTMIISLGRFDNAFEDMKIRDHLRKRHKISEERLDAIERGIRYIQNAVATVFNKLYHDKLKLLKEYLTLVDLFVKQYKMCYGLIFYFIIDFPVCLYSDWSLEHYYDMCIRTLQDAETNYIPKLRGIFKHVTQHRIRLERSRVKIMQKAIKIPYVVYGLAHALLSLNIHPNDVERLLNFKFVNGYRDPLAILKNGVIETWYRCYMVKK